MRGHRETTAQPRRHDSDGGAALLIVLAWSLLMMGLSLVVVQTVIRQIQPSDRSEQSYAALGAAEAGIEDIQTRLLTRTLTDIRADGSNTALNGWMPVPGGGDDAEFTYAIDGSKAGAVGEIRVFVTGRSRDVTRTLEAVLSKRSTLDYVYMSDIETPAPDLPGAYSTAANSGCTTASPTCGLTAQALAWLLCSRHWYETGQTSPTTTGNQRNIKFCQWAGIYRTERLVGKVHTNDVWRLEKYDLSAAIGEGDITSACASTQEGLSASDVTCPVASRFIGTDITGGTSTWTSSSAYQGDAWRPATLATDVTRRNPRYDSVLDLPPSPALLKQRASETGCVYTGPTRIRFTTVGGIGYMYVTSPGTKVTRAGCDGDGGDGTSLRSAATSQVTNRVTLGNFEDLVIYVQNVPRTGAADDPDNDFDVNNQWASGTDPGCTLKGTKKYPYVIPNDADDKALFNSPSGWAYKGFPSEFADPDSPWYGSNCASGDAYLQGSYTGQMTIATQNNVILTSSLADAQLLKPAATTSDPEYGKPNPASQSVLGLVSGMFSFAYRPMTSASTPAWVTDWKSANASNPKYNFALLAIERCFGAQNHRDSLDNGGIYLWGSLAQKYRCAVGINGGSGYDKHYSYDDRLKERTPPYMLELSEEPWGDERQGEVTPRAQAIGTTATWPLLRSDDGSATIGSFVLSSAPTEGATTWTRAGSQLTVTTGGEGLVVFTYTVNTTLGKEIRRLVLLVE